MIALFAAMAAAGGAEAPAVPVSVDWTQVEERVIKKCDLRSLHNVLYQCLLDSNFAVVPQQNDGEAIQLRLTSGGRKLRVLASQGEISVERQIDVPRKCDATLLLTICTTSVEALREAHARIPPPAPVEEPETPEPPVEVVQPVPPEPEPLPESSPLSVDLGIGLDAPGSSSVSPRVSFALGWALASELSVAAQLHGTVLPYEGVSGGEVGIGAGLRWRLLSQVPELSAGLSAAVVYHIFSADESTRGHVDMHLLLPLEYRLTERLGLSVAPYVRLHPVSHIKDGSVFYSSEYVGVLASVGIRVF